MAITFDEWITQTQGRYWDMDGAYGAQCWDLWAKYCMDLYGCSVSDCITPTGYAEGNYTRFPTNAKMAEIFERKPPDYSPVKGDVAFWNFSSQHTGSHVSIVMEDGVTNGRITVLSQNPNPAQRMSFDLTAFLGYLHPKALGEGGGTSSTESNPTGDNSPGSPDSTRGGAWILQQGDNLYLHESDNSGSRTRIFWKSTANNWQEKASQSQPSSDNGQAHPSTSTSPENSYALYVVGTVEAGLRWDAVEAANLQGIGIAQWSFGRRLQVLGKMRDADPTGWNAFKSGAPQVAALVESGGDTFTRPLTASEAEAFRVFAGRAESREGQRRQFAEDYAGYPQTYEDDRMQILWVTAYHQSPANALNVPKASNLAQLKANILATYPFGPYTTRYNTAYSLLSVWDGKSNPPAF